MDQPKVELTKRPVLISLAFFAIASILGLSMRAAFVMDMPEWFNYRYVQHAHSHVALLGWLFAIYYIIILKVFRLAWSRYAALFWGLQGTVLGMLLTFPFMGYASLSIVFSTLHIILSYVFVYKIWRAVTIAKYGKLPVLFLRASLFFLALSTIGTWALGPIMAMGLKGSAIYYASIQFYLHFQFNGWFIFAVLAIFFKLLPPQQLIYSGHIGIRLYWSLIIGTVLTYALAITWSTPYIGIFIVNSIGILTQLLAFAFFVQFMLRTKNDFKTLFTPFQYRVLLIALIAFLIKVLVQSVVVIPALAEISYTIRNLVIGFIHLLMLGGLSLFAFSMLSQITGVSLNKNGTTIFIIGVISTELLLFGQGLMQWQGWGFMPRYYEMVALGSVLIVLGVLIILYHLWNVKKTMLPG